MPVEEIPFPAITICGQGLIREVVKSAIFKQFSLHVESKSGNLSVENMTQEEKTQHYQVCLLQVLSIQRPNFSVFYSYRDGLFLVLSYN